MGHDSRIRASDAYTGNVSGGGQAVRTLPGLTITKVSVGPHDNNCYLLRCLVTGTQLLVDPGYEAKRLVDLVGPSGLAAILLTHGHEDHWQALEEVAAATGAPVLAHASDLPMLPRPPDRLLEEGEVLTVGKLGLEVIHLAGHTPGGIALLYREPGGDPDLMTGDSLFPGGIGNTDGDPDRFRSLLDDVESKLFNRLPDSTWVYPGHGNDTTQGAERPHLSEWRERGW